MSVIDRPAIGYDDAAHAYTIDGEPVPGVSTIAKVGGAEFGAGAWWGWGVAVEGVVAAGYDASAFTVEQMRDALKDDGCTPNARRDKAGERGNAVHDALELLAQDGIVPDPSDYPEDQRGHVRSLVRWFLHYRPSFVATEVMVGSRRHRYAGRYDIRALIAADRLGVESAAGDGYALCLIDLKTSKATYPESHFVQLEGYELASVEMGFPATDGGRWLLRTREDGEFVAHDTVPPHKWGEASFVRSWATGDDFLAYLGAYRAICGIGDRDPALAWERECERTLLVALEDGPAASRDLARRCEFIELGLDSRGIGLRLGRLRKEGRTAQGKGKRWELVR